jgi:hypothetical protein
MAKQNIEILKSWFKTGLKPTQQQFWDLFDSYFHKNGIIPIGNIENFQNYLNEKADKELLDAFIEAFNQKLFGAPIEVFETEEYTIVWDDAKKAVFGTYGDFRVWQNGSLEQVPIKFTTGEDGKPNEYHFILSEIDTLIFIK